MAGVTRRSAFRAAYRHLRHRFAWGLRSDCTAACVAFADLHGIDPLQGCAARYSTASGAARILKKAGGYLSWCDATFGLPRTEKPGPGDLALIASADAFGVALAVCIQPGEYASKTERGMALTRAEISGAWTCPF